MDTPFRESAPPANCFRPFLHGYVTAWPVPLDDGTRSSPDRGAYVPGDSFEIRNRVVPAPVRITGTVMTRNAREKNGSSFRTPRFLTAANGVSSFTSTVYGPTCTNRPVFFAFDWRRTTRTHARRLLRAPRNGQIFINSSRRLTTTDNGPVHYRKR